jgi:hypothetical protein
MFTKIKFRISLAILHIVAKICPRTFKHLDFDCLRHEETNMRIKFCSYRKMDLGVEYRFDLTINGRMLTTTVMVHEMEWEYFRDHPDFMKHLIMNRLHDMIYSHVIEPMLDKNQLKKLLARPIC